MTGHEISLSSESLDSFCSLALRVESFLIKFVMENIKLEGLITHSDTPIQKNKLVFFKVLCRICLK